MSDNRGGIGEERVTGREVLLVENSVGQGFQSLEGGGSKV